MASFSALVRTGRETGPARVVGAATVRRLVLYYAVVAALVTGMDLSMPLAPSGEGRMLASWLEQLLFGTVTGLRIIPAWLDATLAMAMAFVLTVPTVLVYVRTRTHEAYDESLVNTVLVLPSVITAILIVVQSSLALAFSLTGIVAAVRFRSNVKESRDALYIFASVAIGFASGVYALDVAAAASLFFVLLELFAWRSGLGGDHSGTHAAHWPDSPSNPVPAIAASGEGHRPAGNHPHAKPDDRAGGEAKPNPEPKPKSMVLRVEADDLEHGRRVVEAVLAATAKKWQFERTRHHGGRTTGLEYHARLRRSQSPEAVRGRILNDGSPFVTAVEWTP
jgi:small basic protein